jgi:chromosome segregation ATPase
MEKSTMQTKKETMFFLVLSVLILLPLGCSLPGGPVEVILPANSPERYPQRPAVDEKRQGSSVAKRFQQTAQQDTATVDSAIELADKYAKLSSEMTVLQQKNNDLTAENGQLKDQLAFAQAQLQQTQKELTEANGLLREMVVELNNWKTDILGFREEMRDADKAQLKALLQIFQVLGGEVKTELAQDADTGSAAASSSEAATSPAKETSAQGK